MNTPLYSLNPETNNCFNHVFYEENKYPMNPVLFPKTKEMQDSLKLESPFYNHYFNFFI